MSILTQSSLRNRLLTAMSADDFAALAPFLEPVDLPLRAVLVETDQAIEHVNFLESGIASVVATSSDNEKAEVGHIGFEGMSGSSVCLGVPIGEGKTFIQVSGRGHQVKTSDLERVFDERPAVRALLSRYLYTAQVQVAHSALANARYDLRERLARWLLMCHDRLDGDELFLTHEFLSLMLGVRRAGVTGEIHILEGLLVIKATRGNIKILDRQKLEDIAGGCYGYPEIVYDRLIGKIE